MQNNYFFKREVLRFKHFSRKGYALFACLGRVVVVGVLSVATLQNAKATGISTEVFRADNDTIPTDREYSLTEIEVSGTRAPLSEGQAARMVTVLRAQDIQAAAVQSVNDLLKLCVGVDVRQRAPMGAQTDISIRGGTSEHIAILLDGICISDPQTGHNALDLPIQLSEIEHVEVLEGPAARVYGAQSLLGAINIVTKKQQKATELHAEYGSYGTLSVGGVLTAFTNSISGSYSRSDGFNRSKAGRLNNDYEGSKAFYQGGYSFSPQSVMRWNFGFANKRWGSSTSYGLGSDEQYEKTQKLYATLTADLQLCGKKFHLKPAVYWQQNKDLYQWTRNVSKPNDNKTNIFGANLNIWFDWKLGRTTAGYELRTEDLQSTNLGEPLTVNSQQSAVNSQRPNGLDRTNHSWHIEHNITYQQLTLSAGLMALRNTWNKMPYHLYPGIDIAYKLGQNCKAYASWNTSMRLPSYTELYYKVDGHKADPNLLPEKMSALELGFLRSTINSQQSIVAFKHHGTNMIDWIIDMNVPESSRVWQSVNHAVIDSYGFELSSKWNIAQIFRHQKRLRTVTLAYSFIHQKQKEEAANILSRYTLEYLRNKVVASTIINIYERNSRSLNLSMFYRYQDRIGQYTNADGDVLKYKPYSLIDTRLDYNLNNLVLYFEANNLLNKQYTDYGNVLQPGIIATIGFKLRL